MTNSELGKVIRADHDYIELLVKVKAEDYDEDDPNVPIGEYLLWE
jgi:hypothetical protein